MFCFYQNARGLNTKVSELYNNVILNEFDIIGLSETWLTSETHNSELFPDTYQVFRCDRNMDSLGVTKGGGVLVAIRNDLSVTALDLSVIRNAVPSIDIIGCKILLSNCIHLFVFVLYIPPNIRVNDFQHFLSIFETCDYTANKNICIIGDFNIPSYNTDANDSKLLLFNNFQDFLNLTQNNYIVNANNHVLDLVLCNVQCVVNQSDYPLVREDTHHPSLEIRLTAPVHDIIRFEGENSVKCYNFRKGNYQLLYSMLLDVDWSSVRESNDIEKSCAMFYKLLYNVMDTCIPSVSRESNKHHYPPWFNLNIIQCIRSKHTTHVRILKNMEPLTTLTDLNL